MSAHAEAWSVRRVTRIGFLTAAGAGLFILEALVPLPLPFMKIGLANISTLLALLLSGPADALFVVFLRVLAGSLITGSFLGPAFLLAMSAGVAAAAVMAVARKLAGAALGPVGLSLAGSTAHVSTQMAIVSLLYVRSASVMALLPLLLITALVGGIIVGLATARILPLFSGGLTLSERPATRPARLFTWADIGFALILSAGIVLSLAWFRGPEGTTVLVEVGGKPVEKLSLRENRVVTCRGAEGSVTVEVRDGRVRVASAECPNRICVRTGWRSRAGDVIVCVPNKTVVKIMSEEPASVGGVTG